MSRPFLTDGRKPSFSELLGRGRRHHPAAGLKHLPDPPGVTDPDSRSIPAPGIVKLPPPVVLPLWLLPGIGSVPVAGQGFQKAAWLRDRQQTPGIQQRLHRITVVRQRAPAALGPFPKAAAVTDRGLTGNSSSAVEAADPRRGWMLHGLARCARARLLPGSSEDQGLDAVGQVSGGIPELSCIGHHWPLLVIQLPRAGCRFAFSGARSLVFPNAVLEFGPG